MPRAATTKTVAFSTFKHPRPAPAPPSQTQSQAQAHHQQGPSPAIAPRKQIRFARSEASLLEAHGISLEGGELTYDSNAIFRPLVRTSPGTTTTTNQSGGKKKKSQCCGYIGLQKGRLRSWSWTRKKWVVVLADGYYLCAAPKEDAEYTDTLQLDKVHQLHRVESKRFCCAISTHTETWYLVFTDEPTLDFWMTHLQSRCPLLNIGAPTQIKHLLHVTYDNVAMQIKGLPVPWIESIGSMGLLTPPDDAEDPVRTPLTEPSRSPVSSTSGSASAPSLTRPQMTARSMPVVPVIVRSPLSPRSPPPLASTSQASASASSFGGSSRHKSSTRRPVTFFDLEARDLTGTVETVHLLPVARGENGDTWKGKWTGTFGTRQVAIHIIRFSKEVTDPAQLDKFTSILLRELRALHQLRHPNIVRIRGFTRDLNGNGTHPTATAPTMTTNGVPAIISTWIPGGNLMEYLDYARPVRVGLRMKFLAEAAAGLQYLHSFPYPLLHGSFRGSQIQIQTPLSNLAPTPASASTTAVPNTQKQHLPPPPPPQQPTALITNFGLNPLFADEDCRWLLSEPVPSPRWAAPEVLLPGFLGGGGRGRGGGRKETTAKSDVFSFARTVVEVLTSHHPFPSLSSDTQVLRLVTDGSEYIHHKRDLIAGLPPSRSLPAPHSSPSVYRSNTHHTHHTHTHHLRTHSHSHSHSSHTNHHSHSLPRSNSIPSALARGGSGETGLENRKLWSLLEQCWSFDPAMRPSMDVVAPKMAELARDYDYGM